MNPTESERHKQARQLERARASAAVQSRVPVFNVNPAGLGLGLVAAVLAVLFALYAVTKKRESTWSAPEPRPAPSSSERLIYVE